MPAVDNILQARGLGEWQVCTYNPEIAIGPVSGFLVVGKDFHVIYSEENMKVCLVNVPSQNVAFVINTDRVSPPRKA